MTNNESNQPAYDDEIDLIEYIKLIWNYKTFLMIFVGCCLFLTVLYNIFTPKIYRVETTFFIPLQSNAPAMNPFGGYAKMLGIGLPTGIDSNIKAVLESKLIQGKVRSEQLHFFDNDIKKAKKRMKLKKKMIINQDKNQVFHLAFENKNRQLTFDVVKSYIKNLLVLNEELKITAQKEIITVLDSPKLPKEDEEHKPKKLLNLILAFIGSGFLGVFLVFIIDYFKNSWN